MKRFVRFEKTYEKIYDYRHLWCYQRKPVDDNICMEPTLLNECLKDMTNYISNFDGVYATQEDGTVICNKFNDRDISDIELLTKEPQRYDIFLHDYYTNIFNALCNLESKLEKPLYDGYDGFYKKSTNTLELEPDPKKEIYYLISFLIDAVYFGTHNYKDYVYCIEEERARAFN